MGLLDFFARPSFADGDRRNFRRTFTDKQVIIAYKDSPQPAGCATVLDWSPLGFRIRHRLNLREGQEVTVITPDYELETQVVWNLPVENGSCDAGLRFSSPIKSMSGFAR